MVAGLFTGPSAVRGAAAALVDRGRTEGWRTGPARPECAPGLMNGLAGVAHVLEHGLNAIEVNPALIDRARLPIDRMLAFTAALKNGQPVGGLIPNIGAA